MIEELLHELYETIELDREYLKAEGVEVPNNISLGNTNQILLLLDSYNIYPNTLSTSIEEGVCLKFNNNNNNFYLELYNTGEIGYITEDIINKCVIENENCDSINDACENIINFYKLL